MNESAGGGSRIREARLRHGIGVRELARLTGHTPRAVTEWELAEARGSIRPQTLAKVLRAIEAGSGDEKREERIRLELHRVVAKKMLETPAYVRSAIAVNIEKLRGELPDATLNECSGSLKAMFQSWREYFRQRLGRR